MSTFTDNCRMLPYHGHGNTESDTTPVNIEGQGGNQQSTVNFENGLNPDDLRMSETGEGSSILSEMIDLTAAIESPRTEGNTHDNYKVEVEQDDQSSQVTVGAACVADYSEARANTSSLMEVADADNFKTAGEDIVQSCHVKVASDVDSISTQGSQFTEISAPEDDDGNHALKEDEDDDGNCALKEDEDDDGNRALKEDDADGNYALKEDDDDDDGNHALKEDDDDNNHAFKEDDLSFQVTVAPDCTSSDLTKPDEIPVVEVCPATDGQVTAEHGDQEVGRAIDSSCSTLRKCEPCSFDDEEREASGFCVTCLEYICSDCSRDHRRNKITRDHVVLKGDDMPEDSTQFAKIKDLMKCPVHAENDISFECKDHGILICVSCFTENHRKCEHVLDIAANEDAKESMQALVNQFEALKITCRFLAEKKEDDKNVLIKERQELEDKGLAFAAELREHLAELEARFEKKLGNLFRLEMFKLSKETDMIAEHQTTVDEFNGLVSTVGRHGSKKEVIIVNKYIQDRLRKCAEELDQSDGKERRHIKLTQTFDKKSLTSLATLKLVNESFMLTKNSSDEIPDASEKHKPPKSENDKKGAKPIKKKPIKTTKGSGMPNLSKPQTSNILTKKTNDGKNTTNIREPLPPTQKTYDGKITTDIRKPLLPTPNTSSNPNLFMNKCLEKRAYNIKHSTNEKSCYIIDCTVLPDGQIAFLDYANMSLKMCSTDFDIKMMLQFNDRPVSISSETKLTGDTSKIFISFENSKQILCYKVTPTAMTKSGSFSISLYPICIRIVNDSLLILASNKKRLDNTCTCALDDVVELSLRGHNGKVKKETKFNISSGLPLVKSKVISVSGSTLMSTAGREVVGHHFNPHMDTWIMLEKWLLSTNQVATYVDVDANGNGYVCGESTNAVQQVVVSQGTAFINEAFLTGVNFATCLSVDSERHRIIVGAKHDVVVVYNF